jgi:hypothetical protein
MKISFNLRTQTGVYRAAAVLCVCLIFLTGFISAVHFHADNSATPDHSCSLCALAHAGAVPVELGLPAPIFVSSGNFESTAEVSHSLLLVAFLYIRPPPVAQS